MLDLLQSSRTLTEQRAQFREITRSRRAVIVPGAMNALNARIIEDMGFDAVYVTGAGLANSILGMPDIGLLTVSELAEATARISDACSLPLIADIDTGFGNALNVHRTVRMLERAGASALQIEDQVFPKKCGHFAHKGVIPVDEMLGKICAALDARNDSNLQIIARTDARAVEGLSKALDRANAFIEAGADMTFVEAPLTAQEIAAVAELPAPQVVNIVIGGKTPMLSHDEFKRLGYSIVLYANASLQAAVLAIQEVLGVLKESGSLNGREDRLVSFEERQRLVGKPIFDALEVRYAR